MEYSIVSLLLIKRPPAQNTKYIYIYKNISMYNTCAKRTLDITQHDICIELRVQHCNFSLYTMIYVSQMHNIKKWQSSYDNFSYI